MKLRMYTLFGLLLFISTAGLYSCANKVDQDSVQTSGGVSTDMVDNPTKILFDKDVYDFGEINQGEIVKTEFTFTNVGDYDLIISNAHGTCGCTIPEWPKEPIKPGAKGSIHVEFNSRGKSGVQNKKVIIYANTVPNKSEVLLKGTVIVPQD